MISTSLPEPLSDCAWTGLGRLIVMGRMDAEGNDVADVWRKMLSPVSVAS